MRPSHLPFALALSVTLLASPAPAQYCTQLVDAPPLLTPSAFDGIGFGADVAVSGDFVVVGAAYDSTRNEREGAAVVYRIDPVHDELVLFQVLRPSGTQPDMQFGASVAIDGDFIVVGAPYEDAPGSGGSTVIDEAGFAHVFEYNGSSSFDLKYRLWPQNPSGGERMGTDVDIEGDLVGVAGASSSSSDTALYRLTEPTGLVAEQELPMSAGYIAIGTDAVVTPDHLWVWNPASGNWVQQLAVPGGLFWEPAFGGDRFAVPNGGSVQLIERDPATGRYGLTATISPGLWLMSVALDADRIAVVGPNIPEPTSVELYDADTRALLDTVAGPRTSRPPGAGMGSRVALDADALVSGNQGWPTGFSAPGAAFYFDLGCPQPGSADCYQLIENSTGMTGALTALGSTSVVANDLRLVAHRLPANATTFFLTSQIPGRSVTPGGAVGDLCLDGSIGRYVGPGQVLNSGPSGEASLQLDLARTPTPTGLVAVLPGDTWYFQGWHRDSSPSGVAISNFTDSIRVAFD